MKSESREFYLKYLFRNKIYMLVVAVLFFLLVACIAFFGTLNFTGFRLLYLLSRWNYYFSAILSVIAYSVFSIAANAGCSETIDVILKKRYSWQGGVLRICVVVLLLYHLLMIGGLLWCSYRNDGTDYFLSILPRTYAMNILFPQMIFLGVSCLSSCILEKNKIFANSMMLVMLIMSSPLFEKLIWREKPKGFPIDKAIGKIRDFFSIFYQNAQWAPDSQYGLQIEDIRLFLLLFWMLLIFSVLLWISRDRKKRTVGVVCMVLSIGALILSNRQASIYRQDESWDGIFADFTYYEVDGLESLTDDEEEYFIEKYDMKINLNNQLEVSGHLKLTSPEARDEFVLTLYHGYRIKKITSEDDVHLSYERDKDRILLKFSQKITDCDIEIEYTGYSGKYYSNAQAVMLPGYFPWYPMYGDRQIFIQYPYYNGGNGYNPYNRIEPAEITLEIDAACDFVTNLEKKTENVFVGTSDSISIIGGNIKEISKKSFVNILPLELNGKKESEYLETLEQNWNHVLIELEQVFGMDTEALRNKKLIMVSKDMGRNFSNNYFVEFDDYILFSMEYLDSPTYLNYLLQQKGKDSQIGNLFVKAMMLSEKISAEKIVEYMIAEESDYQQMMQAMEETEEENVSDKLKMEVERIGAEQVIRSIVQYLLNPTMESDADFWVMLASIE